MSNRIMVATRKGLFTAERHGGRTAEPAWAITRGEFLGDNVSAVLWDARDGRLYAALEHGHFGVKMHRSNGPGEAWEECAAPAYPKQPEGQVDTDAMGRTIAWTTAKMWVLEPGGSGEAGLLWCGTLPGGLFRSRDRGSSWELISPLWDNPKRKAWLGGGYDVPGIHSICVDPRSAGTVRVAISVGGIWTTRDGGATWDCDYTGMHAAYMPPESRDDPNAQDPHSLVQCAAQPDHLWVQHHNGVFHSADGGRTWREAEHAKPSNFGFAVAVHPREGNTAWFVPAIKDEKRIPVDGQFVLSRTRDGGKSFEVLRRGLPQHHAYDLVYRHGLAIDATGDRLAMGTTTGGLWISEDQGDTWQGIAQHLPPIYGVRFAG
jgi:hypothetical protein